MMLEEELNIRNLIGIVRRQIKLILAVVVVITSAAAVYVFTQTPVYTANALVLVDPRQKNMLDPQSQMSLMPTDNARVESEVEILRSPTTFQAVVLNNSLITDPEFGVRIGWRERAMTMLGLESAGSDIKSSEPEVQAVVDRLESSTSVSRKGLTYLIGIDVRWTDPKKAAELANAVAETYIAQQVEAKVANAVTVSDALGGRLRQESSKLGALEEKIDGFVAANLDKVASESSRADIAQLRDQLEQIKARTLKATSDADAVGQLARQGNWSDVASRLQSQAVAELDKQRQALSASIRTLDISSPEAVDLRNQLSRIDERLQSTVTGEVEKLRQASQNATEEQRKLRDQMRSVVLAGNLPNDIVVELYQLQQEADVSRTLYQELLQRLRGVEAQTDLQAADSRIVSRATPPTSPSSPRTNLILGLALVGSLGLGFGFAFLYENYVGGFMTDDQLEAVIGAPVLSSVPLLSTPGKGDQHRIEVTAEIIDRPLSAHSESIRRLRLGIERLAQQRRASAEPHAGGVVAMIASAVPAEGKTTTAVSVARAFSLTGKSVLLIDCDLRRPSVSKNFGLEPEVGLGDFLSLSKKHVTEEELIMHDPETGVDLILGRSGNRAPTDNLLETSRFNKLLEAARGRYDVVILDTPPLLPVVDGQFLAGHADVVVLVVRWASTSQQEVRSAVNELRIAVGEKLALGTALSQVDGSSGSYGKRYYNYYYTSE